MPAALAFQQGSVAAGDEALNAAVAFMRGGSVWLNQIRRLDLRFTGNQITNRGAITARTAMELYATLLPRSATGRLACCARSDSLAVLMTPHGVSYEHWFLIAAAARPGSALEVAERAAAPLQQFAVRGRTAANSAVDPGSTRRAAGPAVALAAAIVADRIPGVCQALAGRA